MGKLVDQLDLNRYKSQICFYPKDSSLETELKVLKWLEGMEVSYEPQENNMFFYKDRTCFLVDWKEFIHKENGIPEDIVEFKEYVTSLSHVYLIPIALREISRKGLGSGDWVHGIFDKSDTSFEILYKYYPEVGSLVISGSGPGATQYKEIMRQDDSLPLDNLVCFGNCSVLGLYRSFACLMRRGFLRKYRYNEEFLNWLLFPASPEKMKIIAECDTLPGTALKSVPNGWCI